MILLVEMCELLFSIKILKYFLKFIKIFEINTKIYKIKYVFASLRCVNYCFRLKFKNMSLKI